MWPQDRWFGLFVPGKNIDDFNAVANRLSVRPSMGGYFIRYDSQFTSETLTRFGDQGITPFLTFEPWVYGMKTGVPYPDFSLSVLNRGSRDEDLRRIAGIIRDYGKPVYLRLAHEMNGHWYPWAVGQNDNTAQDYLDFWEHVRDVFVIAPNVRWVWSCAAVQWLRRTSPTVDTLFPGDGMVDFAGTTGYGWDTSAEATYAKTFSRLANITDQPFIIPEMGAQAGVNKLGTNAVRWTRSLAKYLIATPRIRGFTWFHIHQGIGATGDYRLDDDLTISALNSVFRDVPIMDNPIPRTDRTRG